MDNNIKYLISRFEKIKKLGWVKSINNSNSGVGRTLENLLNIPENNLEIPDFKGIEIKTHRTNSNSYISLFSSVPDGPHYHEIEIIKNKYGYPDKKLKQYKVLNVTVNAKCLEWFGANYKAILKINYQLKRISLYIVDICGNIVEKSTYWDFTTIKSKLYRKMQYLAYFPTNAKIMNKNEYFNYSSIIIYKIISFNKFIELIENGTIIITFKIGVFKSGRRKGQINDHGTTFKIKGDKLNELYEIIYSNI